MIKIKVKKYSELSRDELHDLLQLRSAVFVVEQNCVYQDIDGKDKIAIHVLGYKDDLLVAYARVFGPGDYFKETGIGRVVVRSDYRSRSYGYDIMNAALEASKPYFKDSDIMVSAQQYLTKFYNNLGFKEEGEPYLEDGIPHVLMRYSR